jgi:hypothetical protein
VREHQQAMLTARRAARRRGRARSLTSEGGSVKGMPSYIYGCGSFQDIRPGILVFWAFGRGYEPLLTIIPEQMVY